MSGVLNDMSYSFDLLEELPAEKFIHTTTGNIISRSTVIRKPQALEVPGGKCVVQHDCVINADLAPIQLNRYVYIDKKCILRPSNSITDPSKFIPLTIGTGTFVGENTLIESAVIGIGCEIGKNCILSKRSILKDYVKVLDDTVIPPDLVLPPFAIVAGNPARIIGEQPESITTLSSIYAVDRYKAIHLVGKK